MEFLQTALPIILVTAFMYYSGLYSSDELIIYLIIYGSALCLGALIYLLIRTYGAKK